MKWKFWKHSPKPKPTAQQTEKEFVESAEKTLGEMVLIALKQKDPNSMIMMLMLTGLAGYAFTELRKGKKL